MTKTFRDLGVDASLCDALEAQGITDPFPIQELTLPLALGGHDLIGQARTGTGKTLAFGLPLLHRLDPSVGRTQALVIVPTRELCVQVHEDLTIGHARGLQTISVYGGVGYDEQIEALTTGVHVVVGTPGRLLDHLNRGTLDLSHVTQLVLDEADEMLDMGFLPDVERLVAACQGQDRHTMLFSATMPTPIVKLARRYMDHPTFTRADHGEERETAPNVEQHFFQVHRMDKPRLLARILQDQDRGGVYVFVRTKHMADRLVNELEDLNTPAVAIHGDLRQSTRERNLDRFRSGDATVLIATEVAARGLDVTGVTHVVNYDCPDDEKMYLHRIGRTARAGESGKAITFAEFNEVDRLNVIRKKVGALESDVVQAFSTSPFLDERFELPETRPWDHLSSGGSGRDGASRQDKQRGSGARGRSDGRPKSSRSQEGRSGDRDARRDRSQREPAKDTREPAKDAGGQGAPEPVEREKRQRKQTERGTPPRDGEADRSTDRSAERTRTRTRTRARTHSESTGERSTAAGGATTTRSSSSGGDNDHDRADGAQRARARNRSRGSSGAGSGQPAGDQEPGDDRGKRNDRGGNNGTSGDNGDDGDKQGGGSNRGDNGGNQAGGSTGGGNRNRGRRSRGGRGRGSGSSSSGSSSSGSSSSGGQGGGRSSSRGSRGGNDGDDRADRTVRVADRGAEARGEGSPQRARRVRVDHLP